MVCALTVFIAAAAQSHAMNWGAEFTGLSWKMDGKDFDRDALSNKTWATGGVISMSDEITQNKIGGSASFFLEGESPLRLGLAAGYGVMPSVSYALDTIDIYIYSSYLYSEHYNTRWNNKTAYVPLDLYVKYKGRNGGLSFFAGGGADYVMARTDYDYNESGDFTNPPYHFTKKGEFAQNKFIPHAQAGLEWFIAKWLSLNVGAKYLFNATLDDLTGNVTYIDGSIKKCRMIMVSSPYGEHIDARSTSAALQAGERLFKYDFSGLRSSLALRVYF